MNNILDSFSKVAKNEGVTITKLEHVIGASKGVLSRAIANNSDIQAKWILKLVENYPQYNSEWLLTGKEPMLKSKNTPIAIKTGSSNGYPLVSVTAIGGFGNSAFTILPQDVKEYYNIPKFNNKKIDFMIEVEGSSMYPKYSSGDIVACTVIKESRFIQWNKTHVIATKEQGIIIKRVKKGVSEDSLTMISDNENYDPFSVPKEEITGIALVVGVIRLE
ncbi:S24 family peptidase [Flavobacterium sp. T12S277]|uniref:S24 family peptidase n=1 Tax=Flavobacterium sp. T12S277 TaxID=3402752 RepID=UPI003AE6A3CB